MQFPTQYAAILSRIANIDPAAYATSRNFTNGSISYLSPYIARGVISGTQVMQTLLDKGYTFPEMEKFIQQLAWREYFQRTWQYAEDDIFDDMQIRYTGTRHRDLPEAIASASTGINAIDNAIQALYNDGYIHNHLRMYIASITCNFAKTDWKVPAAWMYYHLLDGDLASNALSWQWVSGHFSAKQYFCNQDNINKYTHTSQHNTFLDKPYDMLPEMEIPAILNRHVPFNSETVLPEKKIPQLDTSLPLVLYTSCNLDPNWKKNIAANRILLLEPSHFRKHPVSPRVMNFILGLAKEIEGLQIFAGELNELPGLQAFPAIWSKEHPLYTHLPGKKEERDWLFPEISGSFRSFFQYWKKCEAVLRKREKKTLELQRA